MTPDPDAPVREAYQRDDDTGGIDTTGVIRGEEELQVGTRSREAGRVGMRKVLESERASTVVDVGTEHADFERHPVAEADSGEVEILADGSISIPVFQEELVIEKRLVVRERVIVRKHTVTEQRLVEAELRRERVEVEADPGVADRVTHEAGGSWGSDTGETTIRGGAA